MRREGLARLFTFLAAVLIFAAPTSDAFAADSSSWSLDDARFRDCESEAFIALLAARNAIWFKNKREDLVRLVHTDEDRAAVNAVFDEVELNGAKDHAGIAMRQFNACIKQANLDVGPLPADGWQCLAHHDVEFIAGASLDSGFPIDVARARIRQVLTKHSSGVYPDKLIDQVTSFVYLNNDPDGDHVIRKTLFETCLFPSVAKAWAQQDSPEVNRTLDVIGVPTVGPDVRTQPPCGKEKDDRKSRSTEAIVLVARDPVDYRNSDKLRHHSETFSEQFAQALVSAMCAQGKVARVVTDTSTGITSLKKAYLQTRMHRASWMVIVESPITSASKPGIDLKVAAARLDNNDGKDFTVRDSFERIWPVWREGSSNRPEVASALAGEFASEMVKKLP